MEYHVDRTAAADYLAPKVGGRGYRWVVDAAENRLLMRLRGMGDGLHLMMVRKVEGRIESVGVVGADEERVGGG